MLQVATRRNWQKATVDNAMSRRMDAKDRIEVTAAQASPAEPRADPRCPFVAYHNVLGAGYVAGLLDYVMARQSDFRAGEMHDRKTGEVVADQMLRDSAYLSDLGAFAGPIRSFVSAIASPALEALHVGEPKVEPKEFAITAYCDGGHIGEHVDTFGSSQRVRILSCVYYFAVTPRRFSGGELRLYGFPKGPAVEQQPLTSFVDIEPRTDTLVVFPSWIRHQVMPARVPSGAWLDSRFTINCWMHRAAGRP
jgi:SM-20-related protein